MNRNFDIDKMPLKLGETGTYSLECADKQEWNNSGCPHNIVWDGDVPRFRTAEEQEAYIEQLELDGMTIMTKLELSRALKNLGYWADVKTLIRSNEVFEDDWGNAVEVDLADPVFQQGFAMTEIDMDEVKRKIIELRG